ncbi:helix-turn-helix transcriptional regulator [Gordonia sp. NB41Y]|uniref:helix-turn-helix domain-containing protein n=1 Tax=Gordonia sp. NB41Y TaxID=875808 RepID=UPI0002BEDA48|nr:helix-turn-helix transcriptional regulator [Gordonia sp. NB41Y]WLP92110.1 helix-turn-helix transcriptional regulator [Gordonia sp. NB41Y]
MADTVSLGTGPSAPASFSTGTPQLDSVIGRLVGGENILWSIDGDVTGIRTRIRAASHRLATIVHAQDLGSLRAELPSDAAIIVDLTASGSEIAESPLSAEIVRVAHAVFCSSDTVCHWLVDPGSLAQAEWIWTMQVVLEVADGTVTTTRADGRSIGRARVPLDAGLTVGGSRRSSLGARTLGQGVRKARLERGWSQTELGRRVGVSASAISQLERGLLGISLDTAIDVAEQLGMTLDMLARGASRDCIRIERRLGIPEELAPTDMETTTLSRAGLRSLQLAPRATLTPPVGPTGTLTILVGSGALSVEHPTSRSLARTGDTVLVQHAQGSTISNIGETTATVFLA